MAATGAVRDPESSAYLDFELAIGLGQGRDYPVSVLNSPAGKPQDTLRFPFDELQLESRLKDVQIALLLPAEMRRRAPTAEEQGVQRFGRELFDALMTGEIRSAYDISARQAEAQGKGLRIKLRVQSPALASLPWEFLYDPREGEYLCLMSDRPVVRYIETAQPVQPLQVNPPLRILGMVASPAGLPPLNVEQEKLRLAKATEKLQAQGVVELTWLEGQTWRDLQRAMRGGPWHIFHFVGHGGFDPVRDEGLLVMADDAGQPHYLTATDVSRLLADHKPLRLVLLNACEGARGSSLDIFSSTASILVRRGIPAVVAMQYPVTDRAAVEFAHSFYESLADGLPADAAVAEARKTVSIAVTGTAEWGTPVLFMRASDGRIFDITRAPQPAPAPLPPVTASPAAPISIPAAESSASQAGAATRPAPQPAAADVAAVPAPRPAMQPQQMKRPRWLWPAVGGAVGLVAVVVAILIATSGGSGRPTPTPTGPGGALALSTTAPALAITPTLTASQAPTRTAAPTHTAASLPTVKPTSAATPEPTHTATPLPTVKPTSAATPVPVVPGRGQGSIVFVSERDGNPEIYLMKGNGGTAKRLTNNPADDWSPMLSPDGKRIAFTSSRDATVPGMHNIYIMDVDGSNVRRLTSNQAWDEYAAWSPDGQKIAYVTTLDGNAEICVVNVAGGQCQRQTHNQWDEHDPAWSPTGSELAYSSRRSGLWQIYALDLATGTERRITHTSFDEQHPIWSPDGSQIAFVSTRDGDYEIYVMRSDGSQPKRLTNNGGDDEHAVWSPDGSALAFVSKRQNRDSDVYVMWQDGSQQTRLTGSTASDGSPSWGP